MNTLDQNANAVEELVDGRTSAQSDKEVSEEDDCMKARGQSWS